MCLPLPQLTSESPPLTSASPPFSPNSPPLTSAHFRLTSAHLPPSVLTSPFTSDSPPTHLRPSALLDSPPKASSDSEPSSPVVTSNRSRATARGRDLASMGKFGEDLCGGAEARAFPSFEARLCGADGLPCRVRSVRRGPAAVCLPPHLRLTSAHLRLSAHLNSAPLTSAHPRSPPLTSCSP